MSNKVTHLSNNDTPNVLSPRLRFPEFQSDGDWAEAKLGELSDIVRGGSPRPIDAFLTQDLDGLNWLKIGDLQAGSKYVTATEDRVIPGALSKTRVIEPGDLIMSNSMSFGRPYLSQITTCIHDGWIAVRKISKRIRSEFLYYAITAPGSQAFFTNWASGGGIRNLNIDIVKNLPMRHPSPAEQHRIADCLGSLDDLIVAEDRKLSALRDYKSGLMQQLFPREGETRPRLRFPEFQSAGEWEPANLSAIFDLVSGVHLAPDEYAVNGEIPYFTGPSDFSNDVNAISKWTTESRNVARCGDTLITVKGSGCGELMFLELPKVAMGRQLMAARPKNCVERFVLYLLETKRKRFDDLASGNLIPGLSRGDILDLESRLPKEEAEQQRIADCLASLDAFIIAQMENLDALRTHKHGLMQQLFPLPEGVEA